MVGVNIAGRLTNMLVNGDFGAVAAHIIELAGPPPVMCSGGIFPEHTFNGEKLQDVSNISVRPRLLSFSSFADGNRGLVVFSCLAASPKDPCERLATSLRAIPKAALTGPLLRFFFECCENVHIQSTWWSKLTQEAQHALVAHMDATSEFQPRDTARDFLSTDAVDHGRWPITDRIDISGKD